MTDPIEHGLRSVVQAVLWNASNYPKRAQAGILGSDIAPLTAKVVAAVRSSGWAPLPAPSDDEREALPVVAHKGPHDTDESMFLTAADNLDRGYPLGGGNLTRAVVVLIRREVERARRLASAPAIKNPTETLNAKAVDSSSPVPATKGATNPADSPFEQIANRLGEHPKSRNVSNNLDGDDVTTVIDLKGVPVESLAEWIVQGTNLAATVPADTPSGWLCAWCGLPATGTATWQGGGIHPSCGMTGHGLDFTSRPTPPEGHLYRRGLGSGHPDDDRCECGRPKRAPEHTDPPTPPEDVAALAAEQFPTDHKQARRWNVMQVQAQTGFVKGYAAALATRADTASESPSGLELAVETPSAVGASEDVAALINEAERYAAAHESQPGGAWSGTAIVIRRLAAALAARPLPETQKWEYGHDCDESRATHGENPSPQNEWDAMDGCLNVTRYRRRSAGPWLPVPSADLGEEGDS